ncbi:hypothetical protein [Methylosinus sp. Ce-a6]|uniref:hypothetical protein n=1 Tax=Methylosinus sp. Ce-a6 TaxID=2172005 RepID=UPI001358312F|nr:hypothetical protein [Methylosinus sp. Ce-a6]
MLRVLFLVAAIAAVTSSCAKRADEVAAVYVSPLQYETYTCPQIAEEAQRISSRAAQAAGIQDHKATQDAVVTTVGAIVFWPALFALSGDDAQTAELARLRGEAEAIEQAAIKKKCGITFQRQPPQS